MATESEGELREKLKKWSKLGNNVTKVVLTLHIVTDGDARKLYSRYNRKGGVYEKAAIMLFKENHVVHRSLLWKMWNFNKRGTQDYFNQKCPNHDSRSKKQKGGASTSDSKDAKYCYCKTDDDKHEKGAIQCDYCNDWFHITCCNITMLEALLIEKFKYLV
ncbi:unnamed protein product [Allacma fusca]|uniref:PHD-type domain-containing protein n=1 Tax=Allacma fusca TaxID=39272 RepID=A0A8J2L5Q1_9HEXA|nr:unnamed protein product [Allacma fusca]